MAQRITIVQVRKPSEGDIHKELQWLGNSLGLFSQRDKDSSCFRVFITLVKKAKRNEALSSDEIAERLQLSRGTVVHHLSKLMSSGIVVREKQGYLLRENSLTDIVKDLRRDMEALLEEMQSIAHKIDSKLH